MNFFKEKKLLTIVLILFSLFIYCNFTKTVPTNKYIDRNSLHYINDLYYSNASIYNNNLSPKAQKMYDYVIKQVKNHKSKSTFSLDDFNCLDYNECFSIINISFDAIMTEHPELLSLSNYNVSYDGNKNTLYNTFALPFSFLETIGVARIKIIIDNIRKATKDMNDKEKIIYVYDWMGKNNSYDRMFTYSSKNQSAYNVFIKHNAVCAGFAKASQIIFQNIGIESYGVTGSSTGAHMWNIVKYNNKYYFFDSTIATSVKKNSMSYYNGIKQEYMNFYVIDHPEWYPKIESTNMFNK